MLETGVWFVTCYSHCCFGGDRIKWTQLIHNSPFLHQALHKPDCPGHSDLRGYRVTWGSDGQLSFDTALEAEYPWGFCTAYAGALAAHFRSITPEPVGDYPRMLESLSTPSFEVQPEACRMSSMSSGSSPRCATLSTR